MKKLIIEGNKTLKGEIHVSGAKNSVVALIPASILTSGKCIIKNVPNISDVQNLIEMMEYLGSEIKFENETIYIDNKNVRNETIGENHSKKMRASYYFMGSLLGRFNEAKISFPGGCVIGERPIDYHISGFEKLGSKVFIENGDTYAFNAEKLIGTDIILNKASVGATINIMLASVKAEGTTNIINAAMEPEIKNIADFLISMGAKIKGAGTSKITIEGVKELGDGQITVIPDRIEAGTFAIMAALLGDNLTIKGAKKEYINALIKKLKEAGVKIKSSKDDLIISKCDSLKSINVRTDVYPAFPTDLGQPMSTFLTQCEGTSIFEETIYENRMRHIKYLNEMGANIKLKDRTATIKGKTKLVGKNVEATDLRAGAAMLVAGMIAEGTTKIINIEHILRGYENIVEKLSKVGASIKLVDE